MTAPTVDTSEQGGEQTPFSSMDDETFARDVLGIGAPPDPGETPSDETSETTPAPEAGVSVSTPEKPGEAEEAEVEEEMTVEQADAERTAAGWKQDAYGKWHRKDGTLAKANELPPAPEAKKEETPKRELLSQFKAKDSDGKEFDAAEISDINLTYQANGKEVTYTLDHVVKMAQRGQYNEDEQQKLVAERTAITREKQGNQKIRDDYTKMRTFVEAILEDTDEADRTLVERRQKWAQAQSPEARADRAERQRDELIARQRGESLMKEYDSTSVRIAGVMDDLQKQYPSVSEYEILGKYTVMAASFLVGGQVPPERLQEVERMVASELAPWAESLHGQRTTRTAEAKAKQEQEIAKEKGRTIVAKRNAARVFKPVSGLAGQLPHETPKKEPTTHDELRESMFGKDD